MSKKAYNFTVLQLTTAEKSVMSSGKPQVKFTGELTLRGKLVKRTFVAQGASADLLVGKLRKNKSIDLRVMFERAPANDNGRGGEFCSVVALPRAKAA